jgi:acyl dehydratase
MRRLAFAAVFAVYTGVAALGMYEITAKSPVLLGSPLPGWRTTCRVEESTPWRQPTGILPVDKVLHESREAYLFYGLLTSR